MKIILRTNEDDWRELEAREPGWAAVPTYTAYAGHDIPEFVWIDLLRAAGVEVEKVFDNFGVE